MTREEMLLTSQLEALRELVKAMEKTIQAQKETIAALEKRVDTTQKEVVYVPAPTQPQPHFPQQPWIGDPYPWGTTSGGMTGIQNGITVTNTSNSVPTVKPFLSAFTIAGVRRDSRL